MRFHTVTPEETQGLGARLAHGRPGLARALIVVYLRGGLGTGKTTFARGFAQASGVGGLLRSPTYTLLEVYPMIDGTLVHVDLYRVHSAGELDSLGLRDFLLPSHVCLIEWPEHGEGRLPAADLTVAFTASPSGHEIELTPASALGNKMLGHMTELTGSSAGA